MKSTIWLVSLLLAKGLPEISHQRIGEFIVSTCYPGEDYTVQCLEGEVEYPVKQKWKNMAVQGIEFKQYSGGHGCYFLKIDEQIYFASTTL